MLSPGQTAPDFVRAGVRDGAGDVYELFSIVDAHRATLLYFYPADFVPECTADLRAMSAAGWGAEPELAVLGLSKDSIYAHAAYADDCGLSIPLLTDDNADVADAYGVRLDEWEGMYDVPNRAAFLLDGWKIRFAGAADPLEPVSPSPVERAAGAIRDLGIDAADPNVEYDATR